MPAIRGPEDGPVAVTGASGFVGSHVVKNLVESGCTVRGCVRDTSRLEKITHLQQISEKGPGSAEPFACDLMDAANGSYETLEERYIVTNSKGETSRNWNVERSSYAMGKLESERAGYVVGERTGIDIVSVCPGFVLGPLLAITHDVKDTLLATGNILIELGLIKPAR